MTHVTTTPAPTGPDRRRADRGSAPAPIACGDDRAAAQEQVRVRDARDPRRLRARPDDRGGDPADLRDLDLQAGRRRRAPRRLRVQPLGEPHPHRPRGRHRGARGRRARVRVRVRPRRRGHGHPLALQRPATTWSSRTTRTAARSGCSTRSRTVWGARAQPRAGVRRRRRARRDPARQDQDGVGRDAHQPAAQHRRHRGPGRRRARGRRAARRRQHVRVAVPPAAADPRRRRGRCTPPPSTAAATPTSWVARSSSATSSSPSGSPSTRTRWARWPDRSTRSSRTAGSRRWRPDGPALRQRGADRRVPRRPPVGRAGDLPRPRGAPRARGRRAADEALRRHGVVPRHRRRGSRRSPCARRPRCSRSASRSAASSR